uniref:Uncharacterized protein n=1 Tax=Anguilla anguilla TaxID=7936 RepID=A0A0E9QLW8_ANGAN
MDADMENVNEKNKTMKKCCTTIMTVHVSRFSYSNPIRICTL